jgi:hypothetical protein
MFKPGDLIRLKRGYDGGMVAQSGATARVTETDVYISTNGWFGSPTEEFIRIEWLRDGLDNGQSNGLYHPDTFTKIRMGIESQKRRKTI